MWSGLWKEYKDFLPSFIEREIRSRFKERFKHRGANKRSKRDSLSVSDKSLEGLCDLAKTLCKRYQGIVSSRNYSGIVTFLKGITS